MIRIILVFSFCCLSSAISSQSFINEILSFDGFRDRGREIRIEGDTLFLFSNYVSEFGDEYGVRIRKIASNGQIVVQNEFHESVNNFYSNLSRLNSIVALSNGAFVCGANISNNQDSWFLEYDASLNLLDSQFISDPYAPDERFTVLALDQWNGEIHGIAYSTGDGYSQASTFRLNDDLSVGSMHPNVIDQYNCHIYDFEISNEGHYLISGVVHIPTQDMNFASGYRHAAFISKVNSETGEQMWYHEYGTVGLHQNPLVFAELQDGTILSFMPYSYGQSGNNASGLYSDLKSFKFSAEGELLSERQYAPVDFAQVRDVKTNNEGLVHCVGEKLASANTNTKDAFLLITDYEGNEVTYSSHSYLDCWGCRNLCSQIDYSSNGNVFGYGEGQLDTLDFNGVIGEPWLFETDCQGRTFIPLVLGELEAELSFDQSQLVASVDSLVWSEPESINWYLGGELMATGTYNIEIPSSEIELGQALRVEVEYCTEPYAREIILEEQHLGLSEFDLNHTVTIYPNPASDFIGIESSVLFSQIDFLDNTGKLILRKKDLNRKQFILDLSSYESGIYFLRIHLENGFIYKRVIVK